MAGKTITGVQWVVDETGGIVGYRHPITGVDTEFGANIASMSGWVDLLAPVSAAGLPAQNAPTPANFGPAHTPQRREYAFEVGDYVFSQAFHVNHDVKPGGKAYVHMHWSTNGTSTATVKWEFTVMRALGHNQEAFGTPIVITVEQAASGVAWQHMVAECADANALTLYEPDELILVTARRITNGGTNNADTVFGLTVDFHYEADRTATPNKAPNFYG